jgi:hypothetical protein
MRVRAAAAASRSTNDRRLILIAMRESLSRARSPEWRPGALLMSRLFLLIAPLVVTIGTARFDAAQTGAGADPKTVVAGLHGLSLHDRCTGDYAPQPDTCLHQQLLERAVTVGGKAGVVHDVTLRIQAIVEPTIIEGGEVPHADHPYYKVGGTIRAKDWSAWHVEVSEPKQTYWLNHYPKVSHTIYKEDFEATIPMAAGASVIVRVVDGNDRQIDNAEPGRPDRQQIIKGVSDTPLAGQMLRLEVLRVTLR